MPTSTPISREEFVKLTRPLIGLPISRAWRGYGSAIFLEVGSLTRTYKRSGRKKGEWGITPYLYWRVEGLRSVLFGSSSSDRKINHGISILVEQTIVEISVVGRVPELYIQLSNNKWIHTFASSESQPEWAVHLRDGSWLDVKRGQLVKGRADAKKEKIRGK